MKMNEQKVCPFKRTVKTQINNALGKRSYNEYFKKCDGCRCMAYKDGLCLRLQGGVNLQNDLPLCRKQKTDHTDTNAV